jgi:hypothetical protein
MGPSCSDAADSVSFVDCYGASLENTTGREASMRKSPHAIRTATEHAAVDPSR